MNDLISVIVPVYNVEKYLNDCIESIISQVYSNLEIILIDDGSLDNSGKICDEYAKKDSRIKVIHKENGGVSSARNIGLDISTGEWIAFIDSDDWIENEYFNELLCTAKNNNAQIVLCGYNRIIGNKKENINTTGSNNICDNRGFLLNVLNPQTGYGFCHMKIYKKEIIKNIKFTEGLPVGEDALFNEMIAQNITKSIFLNKQLYNYRVNTSSVVKKYDSDYANKYLNSMILNKKYLFNNYKSDVEIIQNYYNYVAYHVMLIAVNYCYHPENKEKNKKKLLKEICNINEFKEAIKKCNYNNLSITRKVTLFTIKYKIYIFTSLICMLRQRQMKG